MPNSGALLVDRFVSASSANDARDSLKSICTALQSKNEDYLEPSSIWGEENILEAFLEVLITSEYKNMPVDQGTPLICQIYTEILKVKESKIVLEQPEPGRLIHSLLDVISNKEGLSYDRVSSLQVLQKICNRYPSIAQAQLLEVPNGLHRLADSFTEENEQVRNEVVLLATTIAQWPSCAKIWVFADVCDNIIDLAVKEGGLTKGNFLVRDCLDLLNSLLRHDPSLSDLVWQSSTFASKLSLLMDLRRGSEFLDPSNKLLSQLDDLDDILQQSIASEDKAITPRLTSDEENVLEKGIDLICIMLGNEKIRNIVWKQHPTLGSLLWELALFSPSPPGVPQVCAVPSACLQQKALQCIALFFASPEMMQRHNGLDRLLFLVCMGGTMDKLEQKIGLSQSALHVIRQLVTDEIANEIVMHTLAPPISADSPEREPTVVLKLVNTILEHIESPEKNEGSKTTLLGAVGALGVFLRDTTSREMVLRIFSPYSLIDTILKDLNAQNDMIVMAFLRFLSDLMIETPAAVEAVLSSSHSITLSVLFGSTGIKATLTGLLLGIAMEFIDIKNSENCGGWNRSSIITMIARRERGVSGFVSDLEELKNAILPWNACRLEQHVFMKWYHAQVLTVRMRLVQQLTGSSQDGDGDGKNISPKNLQDLVTRQSQELENLRKELEAANDIIQSRNCQIEVWKRRVESSPTQLDDMLTEYIKENEDLTGAVISLKNEIKRDKEFNEKCLSEKESTLVTMRQKCEEISNSQQEAENEAERLRTELAALSSAYASLEAEYNQSQQNPSAGKAFSVSTEEEMNPNSKLRGQQPQGEGSSQGQGASEYEAILSENICLRNDAKAADEWMQLAHQRMLEIETENKQLKQEIISLQTSSEKIEAESSLAKSKKEIDEKKNYQFRNTDVLRSLEVSESKNAKFAKEISDLKAELELEKASSTALNEERQQLERRLALHGDNQNSGEGELVTNLRRELEIKQIEVDSLQVSFKALQNKFSNRELELEEFVKLKNELDIKNQMTGELEEIGRSAQKFPPQAGNDIAVAEDPTRPEKEVLSNANLEAECNSYKNEIEQLSKELLSLRKDNKKKSDDLQNMTKKLEDFQEWSVVAQDKLTTLSMQKETAEIHLVEAKQSMNNSIISGKNAEDLVKKMKIQEDEKLNLEEKCSLYEMNINKLSQELSDSREADKTKASKLQEMTVKLDEFQLWSAAAQEKLISLTAEKEALENSVAELKGSLTDPIAMDESVVKLQELNQKLKTEKTSLEDHLQAVKLDLDSSINKISILESFVEEKESKLKIVKDQFQEAKIGLEESKSASLERQEMILDLQEDLKGLQGICSKQEVEANANLNQWKTRCAKYEEQTALLETKVYDLQESYNSKTNELASVTKMMEVSLEGHKLELSNVVEKWSARVEELEGGIKAKSTEIEQLVNQMSEVKQSSQDVYSQLEKEKEAKKSLKEHTEALEKKLSTVRTELRESLNTKEKRENDLKQKLQDQADNITEYIEILRMNDKKIENLEKELEKMKGDYNIVQEREKELKNEVARFQNDEEKRDKELKTSVNKLKSRISVLEKEKSSLIEDVKKSSLETIKEKDLFHAEKNELSIQLYDEQQARILAEQSSTDALGEMEQLAKHSEDVIHQWQERVEELETIVKELEVQLEQQQSEATEAISQWEATCSDHLAKARDTESTTFGTFEALRDMLLAEKRKQVDWINRLDNSYQSSVDFDLLKESSLQEFPVVLSSQTEEQDSSMIKAIINIHASREEIKLSLKSNEAELYLTKESEREQAALSMKLGEDCVRLESELKALALRFEERTNLLELSNQEKESQILDIKTLQSQLETTEEMLSHSAKKEKNIEDKNSSLIDMISKIEAELESSNSERSRFEEMLNIKEEFVKEIEKDLITEKKESEGRLLVIQELREEVNQLSDELKLANESLQVYITDEVSKRAAEMATESLRNEVGFLKDKLDKKQEMLIEERRARKSAEQNIISMREDLALVLHVNVDDSDSDERIKNLVSVSEDILNRKEREEISKIRLSLERSIRDLDFLHDSEAEAKNRALAAETQASASEQEIIAAKADVAFLTQSLEHAREADAARAASFEYRISALEDDRDVMRRVHADEVETLRTEISQILVEKDRIFHALKESEKANAALVYATTKETETDGASNVSTELSKLRASNAHLLAAATKETANAERRIREAVNASASLVEANIIVERELRVAAETAVENVKAQLDEARKSQEEKDETDNQTIKQFSVTDRLQSQLTQVRTKARKFELENAELRVHIEQLKSSTEQRISDITERCMRAQRSAMKVKGENEFDSDVSAEVKKSQSLQNTKSESWVIVEEENFDSLTKTKDLSAVDAYDYIIEQKMAIQEERKIYQELLVEHDNLLALLAQQDLEKESLNTALEDAAGADAVEAAILEAEEKAISMFGKYIQVT